MGPLKGVKVLELAGKGPTPWCAMLLGDMGADVVRVDRAPKESRSRDDYPSMDYVIRRSRRSIAVDLKHPDGARLILDLVGQGDVLIEGFRPGVMERLGLGPEPCHARNPGLVYGRMTGWGQEGSRAESAGHDINFLALTGLLHSIGPPHGPPTPPLNLAGDYGGGGMLLAFGVVCALLEARSSGQGQVVDAAMVDGSALLGSMFYGLAQEGRWSHERGSNILDGGAPFYGTYETADNGWIALGALEPRFYAVLLEALGFEPKELTDQMERSKWPEMRHRIAERVRARTREQWSELLESTDACFAPVLDLHEAMTHPQNRERGVFVEHDGYLQAAPAPRFSRTPAALRRPTPAAGQHTQDALADWGIGEDEIAKLVEDGIVFDHRQGGDGRTRQGFPQP